MTNKQGVEKVNALIDRYKEASDMYSHDWEMFNKRDRRGKCTTNDPVKLISMINLKVQELGDLFVDAADLLKEMLESLPIEEEISK
ncbi:MAG: hypothetical protein UT24_C0011G0053 [Candidatus Woesebacteria bacterium GW2011_GWB1_39_12]|uniref:Uncharacterized protein n=1 Tax=Candidatus Woesebacteria bacterium GW2011_GWB1_39_12 TaxID=1618574 RepID=A0A0G0PR40_9BACT|nr:MAG: hypothetical protein UT24_C0011G0053 [Candidatus Woesebacteria bacterium GW2011_GWB1_39_12]